MDVAVALIGIEHAVGASMLRGFPQGTYGAQDFRRSERLNMQELGADVRAIVVRLLAPLYDVISHAGYDPFADRG